MRLHLLIESLEGLKYIEYVVLWLLRLEDALLKVQVVFFVPH